MRRWGAMVVLALLAAACHPTATPQRLVSAQSQVTSPLPPPTLAETVPAAPSSEYDTATPAPPVAQPPTSQPAPLLAIVSETARPQPLASSAPEPTPEPAGAAAETPPTTTTTLACRDSHDPACGPFRWDPQPAPNQPMTGTVDRSPHVAPVGTEITFTVTMTDPDAQPGSNCVPEPEADFGDGTVEGGHMMCTPEPCDRYGAWTPPPRHAASMTRTFRHTYARPASYTAVFAMRSMTPGANWGCGDPYGEVASVRQQLFVAASP